jgi:hypothetical protein
MTLKIAFLISGCARNYIYTTFSFKKYIFNKCKNADIFISFKENSRIYYLKENIQKKIIKEYKIPIDDTIKDLTYLQLMFGNKLKYFGYDNEEYIQHLITNKLNNIDHSIKNKVSVNVLDQYARVKNIAEIFDKYTQDNNVDYDIVIRLRLDNLWWVNNINLEDYLIDKNKLYFSYIDWEKSKHNNLPNWIQDFFFMGDKNLMMYVMKNFFENLYSSSEFINHHELNNSPEIQLGEYINSNQYLRDKIIVSEIRFNLYSLAVSRPLYLTGYFVGSKKNVYNSLRICLNLKKKYNI